MEKNWVTTQEIIVGFSRLVFFTMKIDSRGYLVRF